MSDGDQNGPDGPPERHSGARILAFPPRVFARERQPRRDSRRRRGDSPNDDHLPLDTLTEWVELSVGPHPTRIGPT